MVWDTNGSSVSSRRRVLLVLQDDLVPTHANAGGTIRFPVRLPRAQVFRLAILSGANGLEGGRDLSRGAAAKHCTIVSLGTAVVQTHDTRVCFGGPVEGTLEESRPCHRASAVPGAAAFIIIATTAGIAVPALPEQSLPCPTSLASKSNQGLLVLVHPKKNVVPMARIDLKENGTHLLTRMFGCPLQPDCDGRLNRFAGGGGGGEPWPVQSFLLSIVVVHLSGSSLPHRRVYSSQAPSVNLLPATGQNVMVACEVRK